MGFYVGEKAGFVRLGAWLRQTEGRVIAVRCGVTHELHWWCGRVDGRQRSNAKKRRMQEKADRKVPELTDVLQSCSPTVFLYDQRAVVAHPPEPDSRRKLELQQQSNLGSPRRAH